ncbi:DUF349 domain-containing protein, partial [Corynebacterium heidelbergense]
PGSPAAATPTPAPVPTPAQSDAATFGRVDEDGTVWVRTANGERQVGQWQAGSPKEGLAHYASRYQDLATEVALLQARLKSHPEEAQRIGSDATALRAGLDTAAVVGDLVALDRQLAAIEQASVDTKEQLEQRRQQEREQSLARKEQLATEAETIAAESTNWKASGDRLREMFEEWRTIRGVDKSTDDALWERFSTARESFHRRRGAHFAELDRNRSSVKRAKEEIIARAEELQDSTDWVETSKAFRGLMDEWKAAGRAGRAADDKLWDRFRAAQDVFFGARKAAEAKKDEQYQHNAEAKQALLNEYSPLISDATSLASAKAALRELQDKWEEVGYVPRRDISRFEKDIRTLEDKVAALEDREWRRTDPELQARVAQFQGRADRLAAEAEAAAANGKTAKAEQLRQQAEQWQEWARTAASATES